MLNKLRYKYYSKYYKDVPKDIPKDIVTKIKNINKTVKIFYGRQNGKTFLTIKCQYIYFVENYNFKIAKMILKKYKKYLG